MKIAKVKLINNGFKGIEVVYASPQKRNNLEYLVEYSTRFPFPIHEELRKCFTNLEKHHRKIMALKDSARFVINGVVSGKERVMLLAKQEVLQEYTSASNTPSLDGDCGYPLWDDLLNDVQALYDEVHEYIIKDRQVEPKQYALGLFDSDEKKLKKAMPKEITREEIEKMEPKESFAFMRKILEDAGAIVMMDDDLSPGAEKSEEEELFK